MSLPQIAAGTEEDSVMKREQRPLYAIAAAVLVIGLVFAGVPLIFLLLLACPLMMVFMMRGMDHGGSMKHSQDDTQDRHETSSEHHHSSGQ